jgi:hypothetical protein
VAAIFCCPVDFRCLQRSHNIGRHLRCTGCPEIYWYCLNFRSVLHGCWWISNELSLPDVLKTRWRHYKIYHASGLGGISTLTSKENPIFLRIKFWFLRRVHKIVIRSHRLTLMSFSRQDILLCGYQLGICLTCQLMLIFFSSEYIKAPRYDANFDSTDKKFSYCWRRRRLQCWSLLLAYRRILLSINQTFGI